MVLGGRGSLTRCLVMWMSGTAVLAAAGRGLGPTVTACWGHRRSLDTLALDQALTGLAAAVLLVAAAWGWLGLTTTVLEAATEPRPDVRRGARPWRLPCGLRGLVLAGCGVALASTIAPPATAGTPLRGAHHVSHLGRGAAVLTGLPLPDRAVAPPSTPGSATRPRGHDLASRSSDAVVVRPGDCLWTIAARDLLPGASAVEIERRWQAIYHANRTLIGPDPDVVEPGQHLNLPRKDPS